MSTRMARKQQIAHVILYPPLYLILSKYNSVILEFIRYYPGLLTCSTSTSTWMLDG